MVQFKNWHEELAKGSQNVVIQFEDRGSAVWIHTDPVT